MRPFCPGCVACAIGAVSSTTTSATTVKPAARNPASVREYPNQSFRSFGRKIAIATKPPNRVEIIDTTRW